MKFSKISTKLMVEVNRLSKEYEAEACTVPMLISALFAIRDGKSFTNLFEVYFEKKCGLKFETINNVLDEMIKKSKEDTKDTQEFSIEGMLYEPDEGGSYDETVELMADMELANIIRKAMSFADENGKDEVRPDYFAVVLFETDSQSIRRFLKKISVNYMETETFFERSKILGYEILPYEISNFVTFTNPLYKGKKCTVVGRKKELNEIYRNLLKPKKRNVILYGHPGVGKTAVGELLKHSIANDKCPNIFKGFRVFEMSVKDFMLTVDDAKAANEKMNFLMNFLAEEEDNIILLIDEIQTILGKGKTYDSKKLDLSTMLKPILTEGVVRIVGITTIMDYTSFTEDGALGRRFQAIYVEEPKIKSVAKMIKPVLEDIKKEKGVTISEKVVDKAIWCAACFDFEKNNPDKSIDVINCAIANAELDNRSEVTEKDVIDVFDISIRRWNGMDEKGKRSTAFHEAGHYVLNRLTNPGNLALLAVSIYPTDEYLGVNVFEYDDSVTPYTNRQYFINEIACDLAGRIAEKMETGEVSAGASADRESATDTAKDMITEFGMGDGTGRSRVYLADIFGDYESTPEIEEEVGKILDEGYEYCEKLLSLNRDYLTAIAEALLEKHILMKEELDEVWASVDAARQKPGYEFPKYEKKVTQKAAPTQRSNNGKNRKGQRKKR